MKASIKTSMVHREHGRQLPSSVLPCRSSFRWLGKLLVNSAWPTSRVVARSRRDGRREGCLQDEGQKRKEGKGESKGVFWRVTVDHVRWTRLGCLRSRNRAEEDETSSSQAPRQSFLSATPDATILIDIFNFHSATRSSLVFDFCRFVERREEIITRIVTLNFIWR